MYMLSNSNEQVEWVSKRLQSCMIGGVDTLGKSVGAYLHDRKKEAYGTGLRLSHSIETLSCLVERPHSRHVFTSCEERLVPA